MAIVISPCSVLFGMPPNGTRTPVEIPGDDDVVKVRVRYRNDEFARCWIKTTRGIRAFYLGWKDDRKEVLVPLFEQGANYHK